VAAAGHTRGCKPMSGMTPDKFEQKFREMVDSKTAEEWATEHLQGEKDLDELMTMCEALVDRYKQINGENASPNDLLEMIASYFDD
jgi:hypothetical protein